MERNYWFLALGVVLVAAAVGGLGWWIQMRVRRAGRVRSWPHVEADVLEIRRTRQVVSSGDGPTQSYIHVWVRYEFRDAAGVVHTGDGTARTAVQEGGHIEVMHDPEDPADHDIVATSPWWAGALLFTFLAVCVAGFGVIALMVGLGY